MPTTDSEGNLGQRLLAELARRRMTGMFFSFGQRGQLRHIDDPVQLRALLAKWGFGSIETTGTAEQILDALEAFCRP